MKHYCKRRLFQAAAGEDEVNSAVLSGENVTLEFVRNFTDTMPFFAERRVLLIEDSGLFKTSAPEYASWIETLPETACVIFSETEADKRNLLYKAVLKVGYAAEFTHPTPQELSNWVLKKIGAAGLKIKQNAFRQLMASLPEDMENADRETDKLISYTVDKGEIDLQDVTDVIAEKIEDRVFKMVEEAAAGHREAAFSLYYDLIALKTAPPRILYNLTRQIEELLDAKELRRSGVPDAEAAKLLAKRDFVIPKLNKLASAYSVTELRGLLNEALNLEKAFKSGDLSDRMAVELLLYRLTKNTK